MNTYLSKKLTFFSFWLMVLVVLLHSLNIDFKECNDVLCNVQYLLSYKLSQIAVPLFFMISGYLYFHKISVNQKFNFSFFLQNNKKRIRTVLLPYVLWCTFWFLLIYILQSIPLFAKYFPQPLYAMSIKDKLLNLYYYPLNYPFWFLRELIVIFLITPVIFLLVKYTRWGSILVLFLLMILYSKLISFNNITFLSAIPLFYFGVGSFLSLNKINIVFKAKKHVALFLIILWVLLNLLSLYNDTTTILNNEIQWSLNIFKNIIGCLAIWYLYDFLNQKVQWRSYNFYNYSFFIFAVHGIPTIILVKISQQLFNDNAVLLFISYLLIVPFIIILSIYSGKLLKKTFPNLFNILVGTRN